MRHLMMHRRFAWISAAALSLALPAAAAAQAPGPAPGAADGAATNAPRAPEYRLVPGDKLRIEVYKDTQLSQSAQVRPDGKITLPLIGDVDAQQLTPTELRDTITERLREYVHNPSVTVIVVETTVPTAYVLGEVRTPGSIALPRDVTVLQALAMAGGLTEFAKGNDIRILRRSPSGIETITFRYKDALKGSEQSQMLLKPGDTVIVP